MDSKARMGFVFGFFGFFFFFLPLLKNFMTLSLYPLHLYSILQFQRAVYFILPNLSSTITITWPGWKDRPCHLYSIGEKTKLRIDTWLVVWPGNCGS